MENFSVIDENGYEVVCKNNKVFLGGQEYGKSIGHFNKNNDFIKDNLKRKDHYMRKIEGYGICWEVIKAMDKSKKIGLKDETGMYVIPAKFFFNKGKFLYFKSKGYEKQLFLALRYFDQVTITKKKVEIVKEGDWRKKKDILEQERNKKPKDTGDRNLFEHADITGGKKEKEDDD